MNDKHAAQALLDNPLLERLFNHQKAGIIEMWETSETTAARERCHIMYQLVDSISERIYADARGIAEGRESDDRNAADGDSGD